MSERKVIDARGSFCPGPLMELIGWIKLAAVGDERGGSGERDDGELDVLAEHAPQHLGEILNEGVGIERGGAKRLFAAEHQQLAGELGRALGRGADHLDVLAVLRADVAGLQQEGGVALDDLEDVVEVVGHAAGEQADRLHLLGGAELVLGQAQGACHVLMVGGAERRGHQRPDGGAERETSRTTLENSSTSSKLRYTEANRT